MAVGDSNKTKAHIDIAGNRLEELETIVQQNDTLQAEHVKTVVSLFKEEMKTKKTI